MKRSRSSEEQIIGIWKEHQAGMTTGELCRKHGISDATFYSWRKKYGGMEVSDAKRLKAPDDFEAGFWGQEISGHRAELAAQLGPCRPLPHLPGERAPDHLHHG